MGLRRRYSMSLCNMTSLEADDIIIMQRIHVFCHAIGFTFQCSYLGRIVECEKPITSLLNDMRGLVSKHSSPFFGIRIVLALTEENMRTYCECLCAKFSAGCTGMLVCMDTYIGDICSELSFNDFSRGWIERLSLRRGSSYYFIN